MPVTSEHAVDPSGARAAIDRYRDLAKYLITVLAAIAGVLVAGTQLSSIGELIWSDDRDRILLAAAGFLVAIGAVAWIVASALAVLKPVELSLDDIAADKSLDTAVAGLCGGPGGVSSITELRDLLNSSLVGRDDSEWNRLVDEVVDQAAFVLVQRRFERAWKTMLVGGLVGLVGIVAFTWAANPPHGSEPEPTVHWVSDTSIEVPAPAR